MENPNPNPNPNPSKPEDHPPSTPLPTRKPLTDSNLLSKPFTSPSSEKEVCLFDWWLIKSENDCDGKRLAVAGFTSNTQQHVGRVFHSSPVVKRYDSFTLKTGDGFKVKIQGPINGQRTHQGFPNEASSIFFTGFPYNWEDYADKYAGKESRDQSAPARVCSYGDLPTPFAYSATSALLSRLDEVPISGLHDFVLATNASADHHMLQTRVTDVLGNCKGTALKNPTVQTPLDMKNKPCPSLMEGFVPEENPCKHETTKSYQNLENNMDNVASVDCNSGDFVVSRAEGNVCCPSAMNATNSGVEESNSRLSDKQDKSSLKGGDESTNEIIRENGSTVETENKCNDASNDCILQTNTGFVSMSEAGMHKREKISNKIEVTTSDILSNNLESNEGERQTSFCNPENPNNIVSSVNYNSIGDVVNPVEEKLSGRSPMKESIVGLTGAEGKVMRNELKGKKVVSSLKRGNTLIHGEKKGKKVDSSSKRRSIKYSSDSATGNYETDTTSQVSQVNTESEGQRSSNKKIGTVGNKKRTAINSSYVTGTSLTLESAKKLSFASPESINFKRSRSGRLLVPPLANWCNQKIVYTADGGIAGITMGNLDSPIGLSRSNEICKNSVCSTEHSRKKKKLA
ncbi:uncharacterized protein LOC143888275 isoform X2 [Tasmannia lanceolata]|uniref:uncharacterized protein LOC143888275 isoform X2 n=1 Tax=Tasmannia lanceolata TaxID=3420 RepID=UPI004063830F